jgi:hypothetical protein
MANNREISQFAGLVTVNDTTKTISIGSAPNITLNASGSISAAGEIKAGNLTASSTTTRGASLGVSPATGQLLVQQTAAAGATNNLIRVFHGNVPTVNITGGGSAEFAGVVNSYQFATPAFTTAGGIGARLTTGSSTATCRLNHTSAATDSNESFVNYKDGVQNFRVQVDGGIKIGGTLPSAPNISLDATTGLVLSTGNIIAEGPADNSSGGRVVAGRSFSSTATDRSGTTIQGQGNSDSGRVSIQSKSSVATTLPCFSVYHGTSSKISMDYSGSADFAGSVQSTSGFNAEGLFTSTRTNGASGLFTGFLNATQNFVVYASGNATFNGTVTATVVPPSDARFKENITPAKPQLADVVALGGLLKNYDWNDQAPLNEELRSQRQLGLVAQEVAEVCPSIVKDINRTKTVEVSPAVTGPEGRVITEAVTKEEDDSYKGISTDVLIMKLIGAVTEQNAIIVDLEARLDAAGV